MRISALSRTCLAVLFLPGLAWAEQEGARSTPARPDPARQSVLLLFDLFNSADRPSDDVRLLAILPGTSPFQEVHRIEMHPPPAQKTPDVLGQTRALWRFGRIGAGRMASVRILIQATLKPVRVDRSGKTSPAGKLAPPRRKDYLRDDPKWLQLKKVAGVSKDWVSAPSKDVSERARQVFDALRKNCTYLLDHKRDSAMDVLKSKKGSCTELSFAFIALCRVHGIPARMASAWVNRSGAKPSLDIINHRWAEYWDDRYGWVPVDVSKAISHARYYPLTYRPAYYFGRVPGRYLSIRDDGQVRPGQSNWSGFTVFRKGGSVRAERSSGWQVTRNPEDEVKLFAEAARTGVAGSKLPGWARSDQPLARYLMIPLLSARSASLRREAAAALAAGPDPTLAAALLVRVKLSGGADDQRIFLDRVAEMLKRDDPKFRAVVTREIGRSRVKEARPLAEDRAKNDPNWIVRWYAKRAVKQIDEAEASTQEGEEEP